MNFQITSAEIEKINTWLNDTIYPPIIAEQKKNPHDGIWIVKDSAGKEYPYFGAIGGDVTYQFTPTSLGVIIKVLHVSGAELDITDYSSW